MLKRLLKNKTKLMLLIVFVLLLAVIRAFEEQLFYDPFSEYFKNDYLNLAFPQYDGWHLFLSMAFRFLLNTVLSLAVILVLFEDKKLTQFAALLYGFLFLLLLLPFFGLLHFSSHHNNFILFYVRRFLIQPLFLLLFVAAFYYQGLKKES